MALKKSHFGVEKTNKYLLFYLKLHLNHCIVMKTSILDSNCGVYVGPRKTNLRIHIGVHRKFSWGRFPSVAHGGYLYLVCAVYDVIFMFSSDVS